MLETYGMTYAEYQQMHPLEQSAHVAFAEAIERDRREFQQDLVEAALKALSG